MKTEQQQPILTLQPEPENPTVADTAAHPLLDLHTSVVQPEPESISVDATSFMSKWFTSYTPWVLQV